jgi:DNA segregation ATPase FtsK/SpoIIIE-like protein
VVLVVVDEIALFAATLGSKDQREEFQILLRDVVARGRAVGIPVVGATQRPSADIIPTSLRDIFGYRCAFRCTTDVSSDIILGFGWAGQGYSAFSMAPEDQGIGWLLAEEGRPRRFKAAYLTDVDIDDLVDRATYIRRPHLLYGTGTPGTSGSGNQGVRGSREGCADSRHRRNIDDLRRLRWCVDVRAWARRRRSVSLGRG